VREQLLWRLLSIIASGYLRWWSFWRRVRGWKKGMAYRAVDSLDEIPGRQEATTIPAD
jgi:hypothetical protein